MNIPKQDDGKIKLNLNNLDHNLKKYFNLSPLGIKASIISGSYSFQNINDITFKMKQCDIDPFCLSHRSRSISKKY